MLKFIKKYFSDIFTILFFGGSAVYSFIDGENVMGFVCLGFILITFHFIEMQRLNNRIGELELKLCDMDIKIGKVKWGIKD